VAQYLKPNLSLAQLDVLATAISDTDCAKKMSAAKAKLIVDTSGNANSMRAPECTTRCAGRCGCRIAGTCRNIGAMAAEYEPQLPRQFRFLTRSLGTRETSNADFMSLFMFVPEYLERLMAIGEADADARIEDIRRVAVRPAEVH